MKKNSKNNKLSASQTTVLLEGITHKLSRSSLGWSYDDGSSPIFVYSAATIKSLWARGLLDANFDDPRGVGPCRESLGVENLDGARHGHSPNIPQLFVWTNRRGMDILRDMGLLPKR
jgi:hypothetical protein